MDYSAIVRDHRFPIVPGTPYFARIQNDEVDFWLVLTVSHDRLPKDVRRAEPVQILLHQPCWIVGRGKFAWIRESNLQHLEPSQKQTFQQQRCHDHFSSLYDLLVSVDQGQILEYFEPQIEEDVTNIDQARSTGLKRKRETKSKFDDYEAIKRQQSEATYSESDILPLIQANVEDNSQFPHNGSESGYSDNDVGEKAGRYVTPEIRQKAQSTTIATDSTPIKQEENHPTRYAEHIDKDQEVHVYIGRHNKKVIAKREDIEKSRVLASYISDNDTDGSYVMHPQLMSVDFEHFDAILQFLHAGEYAPILMENPDGLRNPKALMGLSTSEAYSNELVRAGHLYVLAQNLRIEEMATKISEKIIEAEYRQYSPKSLIKFASLIFNDSRSSSLPRDVRDDSSEHITHESEKIDPLERWTISKLSNRLQDIMCQESLAFLQMEKETRKSCLWADIMLESAKQYRVNGCLPDKVIELS